jgi:hypothetical protein
MSRRTYSTLVNAASNLTQAELYLAPELPTLVALDATLHATINLFRLFYPYLGDPLIQMESPVMDRSLEDKIAESIENSAFVLRKKISLYYAAVKENCSKSSEPEEVSF